MAFKPIEDTDSPFSKVKEAVGYKHRPKLRLRCRHCGVCDEISVDEMAARCLNCSTTTYDYKINEGEGVSVEPRPPKPSQKTQSEWPDRIPYEEFLKLNPEEQRLTTEKYNRWRAQG